MTRREIYGSLFMFVVSLLASPEAGAGAISTNATLLTSATVPSALTLNVTVIDQVTQSAVPTMDFGDLERVGDEFRSGKLFKVLLEVDTVGDPLHVTQVGSALTRVGGSETIPNGAYIADPTYNEADNDGKPQPPSSHLDVRQTVVGTHEIYSDTAGSKRTLAIFYRLSGDPVTGGTAIIPLDQKSGAYSGTIQFTLISD